MNRASLYFVMIPVLGFVAIVHSVVVPRLAVLNVRPDVMVVLVVIWALLFGGGSALVLVLWVGYGWM